LNYFDKLKKTIQDPKGKRKERKRMNKREIETRQRGNI
jgi:hypothetical protein